MPKPAYMDTGVSADLARLISDGAIFIRESGISDIPTDETWVPQDLTAQLGYYGEDGFALTPAPGDTTDLLAHNGDPVVSDQAPGWWTVAFAGLEGGKTNVETYFDVEVNPTDGSITVTTAATKKRYDIVTIGLDQLDRVILVHYPNVQISEREGVVFNRTTLLALGATFRTFKGGAEAPYHFKAWGLLAESNVTEPVLSAVTPTTGAAGVDVDIVGTNLTGVTSVRFGSKNADFVVNSATSITADVPTGVAGSAAIKAFKGAVESNSVAFTRS